MTINTSTRTAGPFTGNGVTSAFPFSYKVFARSDVLVARTVTATAVETVLTLDSDYTVVLNSDQNASPGGTIQMMIAPPVGTTLAATSNLLVVQNLDLTNNGGFYPKAINDALDRVVIFIQQLNARVGLGALNVGAAATIASILSTLTTLAGSTGSSLIGFIQAGVGAVLRTVQDKLREKSVSAFDFMTAAQIADVQAGVFNASVIGAIDAAISASGHVVLPAGNYKIQRAIKCSRARQILRGSGRDLTSITAQTGFVGETMGGSTGSALIWYQAPGLWTDANWVEGGSISDLTLNCAGVGVEGVRINRVTTGQEFKNLRIVDATIGIYGTKWGWTTKFDNVYVTQATATAIRLNNGYNGCTFTNCFLYGGNITTPVLLDLATSSYGNTFVGGAIEGGTVGVRLNDAQIAINGVDFEACAQKFIEVIGSYSIPPTGGVLNFACPPSTVTGCSFVGVPSVAGITAQGGSVVVEGNYFINNGALPGAGIYVLNGIAGGDVTLAGFENVCISEKDNTTRGWGFQFWTGIVASRMVRVVTGGVTFPNPPVASSDPRTFDDYNEGTFTPVDASGAGLVFTAAAGDFTKIGNMVFGTAEISFPVTANATVLKIGGLPYPVGGAAGTFGPDRGGIRVSYTDAGISLGALLVTSNSQFVLFDMSGGTITNAQMSGKSIWLSLAYHI